MKNITLDSASANLKLQIARWKAQSSQLCGTALVLERGDDGRPTGNRVRVPMSEAVESFFCRMEQGMNDPETERQRNEFIAEAHKDPKVMEQFNAIRVETFQNYVLAHQNIISFFFEQVQLANDEVAYAQNETMQEIKVRTIAEDNNARRVRIVKPMEEERIPLIFISTDEVEYTVMDIYKGSVVSAALSTIKLAYDMANQREQLAWDLLNNATIANGGPVFNTSFATALGNSNKALRPWVLNSRIDARNIPDRNDFVVAGTGAETKFRTQVIKEISRYGDRWKGNFPDGDLIPTGRILIPGNDIADLGDEAVIGDSESGPVIDQIQAQGYGSISYLGKNWTLVPDNTLAPGTCYPEFNRKIGKVYSKPGMEEEEVTPLKRKNREKRYIKTVFGGYINITQIPFVARFKYKS